MKTDRENRLALGGAIAHSEGELGRKVEGTVFVVVAGVALSQETGHPFEMTAEQLLSLMERAEKYDDLCKRLRVDQSRLVG